MPTTDLILVQMGQQTVFTTAVAATAKLMGVTDKSFRQSDDAIVVEHAGSLGPSGIAAEQECHAEGNLTMVGTYEDILFPLQGIYGVGAITGVADPYTHTYDPPLGTKISARVYTIEYGDVDAEYKVTGALFSSLKISGEVGGLWQVAVPNIFGVSLSPVSRASLSDRVVEAIRMADTVLYIDAWAGTMGATAAAATLISFEHNVDTKRHLKTFSGSLTPQNYGARRWDADLKLVLEFNATAKGIVDALLTPGLVQRQIRIKATSSTHSATLDFCGTLIEGVELFSDRDGNITVELTFTRTYHTTVANWGQTVIVNGVGTLP